MSVSLEIVVRLFFVRIVPLIGLLVLYIMKSKKVGVDYERKEKSAHTAGQIYRLR